MATVFDRIRSATPTQETEIEEDKVEPNLEVPRKVSVFEKVRSEKPKEPEKKDEIQQKIESIKPKPSEEKELPFEGENDLERDIERQVARGTSRIIETGLGAPGDIEQFARYLWSAISGKESENLLPTSKDIQGKLEKYGQGYLSAQNEGEKQSDDFVKEVASFSLPGSGASITRNLGIPIATNLLKEGIKLHGGSDKKAEYSKLGTMFLLDILSNRSGVGMGGAKKYAGNLFNESEKLIPKGVSLNANKLQSGLNKLKSDLQKGGTAPSTSQAITKVDEILGKINKNGKIPVDELVATRKRINEIIESGGGFEFHVKDKIRQKAINNLNDVKKHVIEGLDDYGKVNPKFGELNRAANEAYGAYSASNVVTNFLKKNFGDKIQSGTLKTILGLGGAGGVAAAAKYFPLTSGVAAASLPIYQGIKIAQRVWNSPVLKKYYGDILKHSLKGSVPATANSIKKLDEKLVEEEQKKKERIKNLKSQSKTSHK